MMPQWAAGRPIRQNVSGTWVGGDLTMIGEYNVTALEVSRREFRLSSFATEPLPVPGVKDARAQPSRLLNARLGVVGFTRRERELAVLHAWREQGNGSPVAAFLIDGEGGSGKTRLARQFMQLSRQDGWAVWEASLERAASVFPWPEQLAARRQRGTVVLADYAERWPTSQLIALAEHLRAGINGKPVRLLLLSRAAGEWWEVLSHRLDREGIAAQAQHLQPLFAGPRGAGRLFAAAKDRFADILQVPDSGEIAVPDLRADDFGLVLAVHMAALVAVDARLHGSEVPDDPARLSAYLLRRERDAWHSLPPAENQRPRSSSRLLGRAVYTAILTGPLPRREAEQALARARLATASETAAELLDDHRVLYPPRQPGTDLEPIYPDRLAEDYLGLATPPGRHDAGLADPWAADMPATLLAPDAAGSEPPAWSRAGMAVLIQTAVRWKEVRTGHLYPLLRARPELATVAGSAGLTTLIEFDDIAPDVLDAIEPVLAEGRDYEVALATAALTRRVAERRLAGTTDPGDKAGLRCRLGDRYSAAGLHKQAIAEYQEAVAAYRVLAPDDPDRYQGRLADALLHLSGEHAALDQHPEQALALAEEAVGMLREADQGAAGDLARLISARLHLSYRLRTLGRADEALAAREEAVALARRLAEIDRDADRDRSRWSLARSLPALSRSLGEAGRATAALAAAREGVQLARQLAEADRNRHLGLLAWALDALGEALKVSAEATVRLPVARESVELYRLLAKANANVYLDSLATALGSYWVALSAAGQDADALDVIEEELSIRRELARADTRRYGPIGAAALCDYSDCLSASDRAEDAIAAAREALGLARSVPGVEPAILAMAMTTLSKRLTGAAHSREGLPLAQATIALFRELVASGRDDRIPDLADALDTLSAQQLALGQHDEARAAAEEAVSLLRALASGERSGHHRALAGALTRLARALNRDPGHLDDAVRALREAVGIVGALVSPQAPWTLWELADRQIELIGMLSLAKRDAEALPLTAEALANARSCVEAAPGAKQLTVLYWALHDFAWTRWATEQDLPAAADRLDELVRLLRASADDHETVRPGTSTSMRLQAMILTHLGRHEEANSVLRALVDQESSAKRYRAALTPTSHPVRRWYRLGDMADLDVPHGAEALAVAAVTAREGSRERGWAISMLKLRRWREKHPDLEWLVGGSAEEQGLSAAALLADVTAFDAGDRRRSARSRVARASELAKLGDPRGAQHLVAQAEDPSIGRRIRRDAARALTRAGDPRGQVLLADIRAERAGEPDGDGQKWPLAEKAEITPVLRGVSPAARSALSQLRPDRAGPGGPSRARLLLHRCLAALAFPVPLAFAVLLGDAIAQARGSHPGPGNWAALCASAFLLWNLISVLIFPVEFAARVFGAGPDRRESSIGCYALLMPLLIVAGYFLAHPALEFLQPAGTFVWDILIWR